MHTHSQPIGVTTESRSYHPQSVIDPNTGATVQYVIQEERHRTIYVASPVPPDQLHPQTMSRLFESADDLQRRYEGSRKRRRAESLQSSSVRNGTRYDLAYQSSPTRSEPAFSKPPSPINTFKRSSFPHYTYNTPPSPIKSSQPPPRRQILFYHKHEPYYEFTNFSPHPVTYKGKVYPTSEHLFQSFKFLEHRPYLAEHIRTCSDRPSVAFSEARRFQPEVRHDWLSVNVQKMDDALWHKFTQHDSLKRKLLATGDAELIENSDRDAFWGIGADGKGRNELGKALERLRTRLRNNW
ncbi:DUF1768-domain-containing protein [Wolfiporia cocos MD-104 SS10]|uniref:DUF1768-domain-containing protein n=1 Tax=Wolfiporia cocos (strain MD-104) TaxID=742152 RepID=A0A2H3JWA5_WOLCO|nr:DUF1768-domain-containing protein [Wolfiporia cocos MD-104 SS10]